MSPQKIDYSLFTTSNLIILHQPKSVSTGLSEALKKFYDEKGNVFFIPALSGDIGSYNQLLKTFGMGSFEGLIKQQYAIKNVNYLDEIFKDVFEKRVNDLQLPLVKSYFAWNKQVNGSFNWILQLENDDYLVVNKYNKKHYFYLLCTDITPENSTLTEHSLFVPIIYKSALNSIASKDISYFNLKSISLSFDEPLQGKEGLIYFKKGAEKYLVEGTNNSQVFLPNELRDAGIYDVLKGDKFIGKVAINYHRKESNPKLLTVQALENKLQLTNIQVNNSDKGAIDKAFIANSGNNSLWKYCLGFVLLFLVIEMLLVKYFDPLFTKKLSTK